MKQWHLIIDVGRCHDCNNCFLADKDEFVGNTWLPTALPQPRHGHRWMNILRQEGGQYPVVKVAYLPLPCQHCAAAPCLDRAPAGTVYRRPDGLVIIDPETAKGHPEIVDTCPYGAIYWNDTAHVPQKCTGCAHLLDQGWTHTRCSQVCPTDAIELFFAEEADMAAKASAEGLETYRGELGTAPRVYYRNLYKWTKIFLAGSVAYCDTDECVEGARVCVRHEGGALAETVTNNYGEFVLDRLESGSCYTLTVDAPGYQPFTTTVRLEASRTLDCLFLERA